MNSLDEIFSEALNQEAMPTTQERRSAVAEVTVHGARRQRRIRAVGQAVGALAVVGLAAAAATVVLGRGDAPPANATPTPTASFPAPSPSPVVTAFADEDPRMPFADPMTSRNWASLDASWDVELAALTNPDADGSSAQLYLTSPDGERTFAYGYPHFELTAPILLSFDPATRTGFVFDDDTKTLNGVDFKTARVTGVDGEWRGRPTSAAPLGRSAGGHGVFAVNSVTGDGATEVMVYVVEGDGARAMPVAGRSPSPVWGDKIVTRVDDGFVVTDVESGESTTLARHPDCVFLAWTLDGTFVAICGDVDAGTATAIEVDPATRASHEVDSNATSQDDFVASYYDHAIDSIRWWTGDATSGRKIFPPAVYVGEQVAMLSTGFSVPPDSYAVIFGIRD